MKKGDYIGGYVLTTDPREGGGHSQWAFASQGGTEYFIKRFLSPTYPLPDGPGGPKVKAMKRTKCAEFERHHRWVMNALRPISGEGSNLVITREFFRDRAHYYKVTSKVDVDMPKDVSRLPRESRLAIMLTASRSLNTLHRAGLVHGDVKPENLLIKAHAKGFAVKVIDFDNCFGSGKPPTPDVLVGDPTYYSPELLQYILGQAPGDRVTEQNDVFALGMVFWQYLTGARPTFPARFAYAAEAVREGAVPVMPKRAAEDGALADLAVAMLANDPAARPSMFEVHDQLTIARRVNPGDLVTVRTSPSPRPLGLRGKLARPAAPAGSADGAGAKPEEGRLRGKLARPPASPDEAPAARAHPAREGQLRGKLMKKDK
jgi:serine/threonine protein kinase